MYSAFVVLFAKICGGIVLYVVCVEVLTVIAQQANSKDIRDTTWIREECVIVCRSTFEGNPQCLDLLVT